MSNNSVSHGGVGGVWAEEMRWRRTMVTIREHGHQKRAFKGEGSESNGRVEGNET